MQSESHDSQPHVADLSVSERLLQIYHRLFGAFGDRGWWPAQTREEVIIGAILVQNVTWANTEKALAHLRRANLLTFASIYQAELAQIEACVLPTRYYKMKAKKLKAFAEHVHNLYAGSLATLLARPLDALRRELLAVYGIGPETADVILVYAAELPSFVVDAYTRRIFERLGYAEATASYDAFRAWFMHHLPNDAAIFNQYHALLDGLGHDFCLAKHPRCEACPLWDVCATRQAIAKGEAVL